MAQNDLTLEMALRMNAEQFVQATKGAGQSFAGFREQIAATPGQVQELTGVVNQLGGALTSVKRILGEFAAILAGGEMFNASVKAFTNFAGEVGGLQKKMGLSNEAANDLNIALKLVGSSSDEYGDAVNHLGRQLRIGEDRLNAMGMVTRDANGNLLDQKTIMDNALKTMMSYKVGIDRNLAAMDLFGRGADDMTKLVKVNAEVMQRAAELRDKYHMGADQTDITSIKEYKSALFEVEIAGLGVGAAIGRQVLPILEDMGEWFKGEGSNTVADFITSFEEVAPRIRQTFTALWNKLKEGIAFVAKGWGDLADLIDKDGKGKIFTAVNVVDSTLKALELTIVGVKGAFQMVGSYIAELAAKAVSYFDEIGKAVDAIKNWKPDDLTQTITVFSKGRELIEQAAEKDRLAIAKAITDEEAAILTRKPPATAPKKLSNEPPQSDGWLYNPPPKEGAGGEGQFAAFKSEMERQKEASQDYFKEDLAADAAYWERKKQTAGLGAKDLMAIDHELFQIHKQQAHNQLSEELEELRTQRDNAQVGSQQRIDIAKKAAQKIGETYGFNSSQFARANRAIEEEEKAHRAKMKEFADLQINLEKSQEDIRIAGLSETLRYGQEMEILSAREVMQQKKAIEEQTYQNSLAALNKKLALAGKEATEEKKLRNEITLLNKQHDLDIVKSNHDLAIDTKKRFDEVFRSIESSMSSSLTGIIKGTETVKQAMGKMLDAMLEKMVQYFVQMAGEWVEQQLLQKVLGLAGLETEAGMDAISIKNSAVTGSAAAFASTAAIPILGPEMAPEVAAGVYASIMAMTAGLVIPSAAMGWDVPAGINPIVQIHEKEMILTAEHGDTIRSLQGLPELLAKLSNRGGGGDTYHLNVSAVDTKGFQNWFNDNAHTAAPGLRRMARNGIRV